MSEPDRGRESTSTCATLLVDELVTALVNSRIYALDHPRLRDSMERALELTRELADLVGSDRIRIACSEGMIFFAGKPLVGASIAAARLVRVLEGWDAGGIELARAARTDELATFFAGLQAARQGPTDDHDAFNRRIAASRCIHIALLPTVGGEALSSPSTGEREVVHGYQKLVDLLQGVTVSLCRGGTIDFDPVIGNAEMILGHLESGDSTMLGLARQEQYDAFSFGHSIRVAILAMNFARALTDDREVQIRIGAAALLHDVGKSLIPFEILHSTRQLSAEERREMSRHSELGARCLLDHHDSDPLAIAAAFGHHMAMGSKGYPTTVHEHPISWITSLVKICDIFEALTAARPYKTAMSPIRAYRVMLAMGDSLDRALLHRFIEVNGIYPVGQSVVLASGEVAIVKHQTDDPLHPIVLVTANGDGSVAEDEELFDLREVACPEARIILGELAGPRVGSPAADR
ncbi:MAG: HD domain-containing protein [Planctomycetes bacterium]|nr:HD domain-containing protein [Planctomycetota bacterium]